MLLLAQYRLTRWPTLLTAQVVVPAGQVALLRPVKFRAQAMLLAPVVRNGILRRERAHRVLSLRLVLLYLLLLLGLILGNGLLGRRLREVLARQLLLTV